MIGIGERGPIGQPASREERLALATLVSIHGLGPMALARLLAACGSAIAVLGVASGPDGPRRLREAAGPDGSGHALSLELGAAVGEAAGRHHSLAERVVALDLHLVVPGDAAYPRRLQAIELPPALLFVRGDPAALDARHAVAVVGTRRPTDAGRRTATRIGTALARADALVVSGLAIGIDGSTHAAVVEAGGRTVAFIGGGHGRLFPAAHDRLAEAIVRAGGAVASEYAPDVEPTRGTFPRRNRLISGATDAVVVVEAGARSGALLTASWALEQGRECFLVPGSIDAPMSAGCLGFLRDWPGAARIVSGIPQLLDDLGLPASAALPRTAGAMARSAIRLPSAAAAIAALEPRDRPVAGAVASGMETVDELMSITGLTVGAVLGALTRLEMAGLVAGRHGRYIRAGALDPNGSGTRLRARPRARRETSDQRRPAA